MNTCTIDSASNHPNMSLRALFPQLWYPRRQWAHDERSLQQPCWVAAMSLSFSNSFWCAAVLRTIVQQLRYFLEWRNTGYTASAMFSQISLRWTYTTPPPTHAIQFLTCTMCYTDWRLQSSESIGSWVWTRCRSATLRLRHNIAVLCLWLSSASASVIFKVLLSNDNQTLHGDQTIDVKKNFTRSIMNAGARCLR